MLPGYLTEVYCAFTKQYNKSQQQCQIKNPGSQLTIRKERKGNQPPGFNKRSETTDQLHIKYRTSSANVNSKKQKKTKKQYKRKISLYLILYIIFIHSFYKTTGFYNQLILRDSVIEKRQKNDKKTSKKQQKSDKKATKKQHFGLTYKKNMVVFATVKKRKEATWQSIT